MITLSQPGGAGYLDSDGPIKVGILCYLASRETKGWQWVMKAPEGSVSRLSAFKSPYPSFPPDVPGTYEISFTDSNGKVTSLKVKAV